MSLNVCLFSGRITKDPDMAYTSSGLAITKFNLAVDGWSKGVGKTVMFLPCVCFDKVAEKVSQHIKRGDFIEISGKLDENKWMDKNSVDHTTYSIICSLVEFTPAKGAYAKQSPQPESSNVQMPPYYQDPEKPVESGKTTVQEVSNDPDNINYVPY